MNKHIAVAVALMATALTGLAQSASLTIQGTVAKAASITVTPQGRYNTLPVEAGCADEAVASVTEKCNSRAGYTVTLRSANAGSSSQATLNGTGTTPDTVNYSVKYDTVAVALNNGVATVTTAAGKTPQAGVAKSLSVTVPASWVNADTYSDTLTLTIAAN